MIKVRYAHPDTRAWNRWRDDAKRATDRLVAAAEAKQKIVVKEGLYKRMRDVLFSAFNGKCAYCESVFALDQPGDVEHYRPKAAVVDENDAPVLLEDGSLHPGYYWLAYETENLIPSCRKCNTLRRTPEGRLVGKGTRFPVVGFRASKPGEHDREMPVFLHPLRDEPDDDLRFEPETGLILGTTARGHLFVKLMDLNREPLPETRRRVYTSVVAHVNDALNAISFRAVGRFSESIQLLSEYRAGKAGYSMAGRKALDDHRGLEQWIDQLRTLICERSDI